MTNKDKVYEAKLKFSSEELTENELQLHLEKNFEKEFVKLDGHEVTALFYVSYDPYTDYEDALHIQIGHVLAGGKLGQLVELEEIEA